MSTENAAEKEKLTGLIKPGTTLMIDFDFEDGKKTRRVVPIPERQGKNNATGSEGNSDGGLRKTLF